MAVISMLGITFNTTAGNKTVVATPAVGDLIIIVCANTGRTSAQVPVISDNNSDGLGAAAGWVIIPGATCTKATSVDSMWAFVRKSFIGSATSTTFTFAPSGGADTGGGLQVFKATVMPYFGLTAIRQSAKQDNQAAAGTPAPVFGVACNTGDSTIGAVFNATSPATLTARTSWTESQDVGYATPTTGLETMFRNGGETGTTQTWGSTSASAFCSLVIELNSLTPDMPIVNLGARAVY